MTKIIKIVQPDDAPLHLTWVINNICTNSCSYCPSILHSGKNHHYDWKNAKRFFELLFEKYPRIHCSVAGGEPSISPFLPELAKTFFDHGHTIGLTSNAAKPVTYWKELAAHVNYICFSWHPEFPDEHFIEKVTEAGKIVPVTARVVMLSSKWQECLNMFNILSDIPNIGTESIRLVYYDGTDPTAQNYTEEQLEWFLTHTRNHLIKSFEHVAHVPAPKITADFYFDDGSVIKKGSASDLMNMGLTNFDGYTCEIGLKSLYVDFEGLIYLGNCQEGGIIGNINDPENIQWPTQPIICRRNLCHCTSDISINKWIDPTN